MDVALACFREVVRLGSIRKAADYMNLSASSVSRQVQKLEHSLDAVLLQRNAQGVCLTPEGAAVARFVEGRAREMERLRGAINDLKGLRRGHVTIFSVEGMVGGLLPRGLADFSARYPGVTYEIWVGGTDTVMDAVAEDRCDIGIAFHPKPRRNIEVVAVFAQPLLALMAPDHPLAARQSLSIHDLRHERVGLPDASFGIRHLVDHAVISEQAQLSVHLETNSIDMLRQYAVRRMGVVFLPAFACEQEIAAGRLVAVRLVGGALSEATVHLCRNSETEPTHAARALLATLVETARPG